MPKEQSVQDKISQMRKRHDLAASDIPRHIAIIMDGNGRWAKSRGFSRIEGHRKAATSVREAVETCAKFGVKYLTLYAFSAENWSRPKSEVKALMYLLRDFLIEERSDIEKNDIRLNTIGRVDELPDFVTGELENTIKASADNKGLVLTLALNYGSRPEILDTVKRIVEKVLSKKLAPDDIDENTISDNLDTAGLPDPDLLIRTSGEFRISNFMLWQISYSELWITPVLWPDFREEHMIEAIKEFSQRERRYGKVGL